MQFSLIPGNGAYEQIIWLFWYLLVMRATLCFSNKYDHREVVQAIKNSTSDTWFHIIVMTMLFWGWGTYFML